MADFEIVQSSKGCEFIPKSEKALAWVHRSGTPEELSSHNKALVRSAAATKGLKALLLQGGLTVDASAFGEVSGLAETEPPKDFWERSFDSPTIAKYGCVGTLGAIAFGSLLLIGQCSNQRQAAQELQAKQDAADRVQEAKDDAESRRKGFNCLSPIDGSEPDVVDQVKVHLRDPDSFEHIETRITPDIGGGHRLVMTYRSRNGFGGMVTGRAKAVVIDGRDRCIANVQVIK